MARILVIEDNPANLELMAYLLRAFGHEVLEAPTGEAGLALAREQKPDAMLCDLQLPDIDGHRIAQAIRSDPGLAATPLVAVTAFAMSGDRERALSGGFDGYISKPIVPEAFLEQIAPFLPSGSGSQPPKRHDLLPDPAPRPPSNATVLLVDDLPTNLDVLQGILEPSGYVVRMAHNVREALTLARTEPPDLIITDVVMPGSTGLDLLKEVRSDARLRNIPVVLHSATSGAGRNRARAMALGASAFLVRPIEPRLFLAEIEGLLRLDRSDGGRW